MLHARASSVPLIRSLALSGLDSRRGMFVDGDAVQGTLSRRRTMDNNGAFQGGTVCPVTLRELMSLALHFLMTDVTPKYEF